MTSLLCNPFGLLMQFAQKQLLHLGSYIGVPEASPTHIHAHIYIYDTHAPMQSPLMNIKFMMKHALTSCHSVKK